MFNEVGVFFAPQQQGSNKSAVEAINYERGKGIMYLTDKQELVLGQSSSF